MQRLLAAIIVFGSLGASAQNDPLFSHYMLNPIYQHPGWAGVESESFASTMVRSQWTGYNPSFDPAGGAPSTQFVNLFVAARGVIDGFGVSLINDNLGPLNNIYASFPIAKKFELGYSSLTIGVSPGLISQTQRFDELRFVDPSDPLNVGTRQTNIDFNLGAGIVYKSRSGMTTAVSVNNITQPGFDYGLDTLDIQNTIPRSYSFLAGYTFLLTRDLNLNPNLQLRSDFNSFTFDAGVVANYRERGWAGLSYRLEESVTFLIGYSFLEENKLKVGYAFGYVIDEQEAKQPTSQEFYIRYDLPDLLFGGRKQVKTPRFTY